MLLCCDEIFSLTHTHLFNCISLLFGVLELSQRHRERPTLRNKINVYFIWYFFFPNSDDCFKRKVTQFCYDTLHFLWFSLSLDTCHFASIFSINFQIPNEDEKMLRSALGCEYFVPFSHMERNEAKWLAIAVASPLVFHTYYITDSNFRVCLCCCYCCCCYYFGFGCQRWNAFVCYFQCHIHYLAWKQEKKPAELLQLLEQQCLCTPRSVRMKSHH